jgi:hypothetical protein
MVLYPASYLVDHTAPHFQLFQLKVPELSTTSFVIQTVNGQHPISPLRFIVEDAKHGMVLHTYSCGFLADVAVLRQLSGKQVTAFLVPHDGAVASTIVATLYFKLRNEGYAELFFVVNQAIACDPFRSFLYLTPFAFLRQGLKAMSGNQNMGIFVLEWLQHNDVKQTYIQLGFLFKKTFLYKNMSLKRYRKDTICLESFVQTNTVTSLPCKGVTICFLKCPFLRCRADVSFGSNAPTLQFTLLK